MSLRAEVMSRARLAGAGLLAAAVVAGGLVLERGLGPRELSAGAVPPELSGAWFCPHGGSERWRSWIVVANPTDETADVHLVSHGRGRPTRIPVSLGPRTQRYVEVSSDEAAASTTVEYFGGPVAAGMVVVRDGEGGRAAEPCLAEAGTRWYLPEGTTLRGFDQRVVVMNPFAQEAVVSLWLTDERETLKPGELAGLVLPARRARAFDLGEFALGKETLAVTVDVGLGKVAVAGLGISSGGLRAAAGVPGPAAAWVLPGAADTGPSALTLQAPAARPVPYRVRRQGAGEQAEVVSEASVEAGKAETIEVDAVDSGLVVTADGREPIVAGRRLEGTGDLASVSGAAEGARTWVALPASGPEGGEATLLVENPSDEVARVRISLLTETGAAEAPEVSTLSLPPGTQRAVDLASLLGEEPVSALVVAEVGSVVVGQAAEGPDGYAVALGVRLEHLPG